ncbi:MAG: hypothetical protein NTW86_23685 [Candidatus Sumerlaeota bacterium]|nr:hypothetical protein [Candidatus Sumerlaeota bacterium]
MRTIRVLGLMVVLAGALSLAGCVYEGEYGYGHNNGRLYLEPWYNWDGGWYGWNGDWDYGHPYYGDWDWSHRRGGFDRYGIFERHGDFGHHGVFEPRGGFEHHGSFAPHALSMPHGNFGGHVGDRRR